MWRQGLDLGRAGRLKQDVLDQLLAAIDAHRATVLALRMPSGEHGLLFPMEPSEFGTAAGDTVPTGGWPMDAALSLIHI